MNVGAYIKTLRIKAGLSQEQLGSMVGVQRAAVQKWECGKVQNLKRETIKKLSDIFDVPPSSFIEDNFFELYDNLIPLTKIKTVPLLGEIACGEPILAVENVEKNISMPEDINADFALKCKGDSMIGARIYDGDIVYIRQQPDVENGEIAAVLIDNEATLKRVKKTADKVMLWPENQNYEPLIFVGDEINNIKILGKAVAFTSIIDAGIISKQNNKTYDINEYRGNIAAQLRADYRQKK